MNFNRKEGRCGRVFLAGMLFLLMTGCAGKKRERPLITLTEKAPPRVCRIAVLPFQNQTKYPAAGLMLYRIFMAELANYTDFHAVEEGEIRRILLRGKVYPGQTISPDIREMIVKATGVDALLSGEVQEAAEERGWVHLAFSLRVREAKTGRLLWTTYYARNGEDYRKVMHFGTIDTLSGLAKRMLDDVLENWHEKGLGGCQ